MVSRSESDIYCEKVIPGKLEVEVIFETDSVLAFRHTDPFFEVHNVVIPKEHIESLTSDVSPELIGEILDVVRKVAVMVEDEHGGCRVSTNVGDYQTSKHLHFYVHSGQRLREAD